MLDPYAVLGLTREASDADIKRAYRRLARETHPDRNPGDPSAGERFKAVAKAYETLSNPALRSGVDGVARAVARGDLPESFMDDVASAIERAQTWIEVAVLPEVVRHERGRGAEMAVRFLVDLDALAPPHTFEPPSWWARRRAARVARSVQVGIERWRGADASTLMRERHGYLLLVHPDALWHGGIRTSDAIDEVVMKLMLARYAQVVAVGRPVSHAAFDADPEARERAVQFAAATDDAEVRRRVLGWIGWLVLAAVLSVMLYSGYVGR